MTNKASDPVLADKAYFQGVEFHKAGNPQAARQAWLTALELQPDHTGANHFTSLVLREAGEFDAALPHAEIAYQAVPSNPTIAIAYGDLLYKTYRFARALEVFQDLEKQVQGAADVLGAIGGCYMELGQHAKSLEVLRKALALNPGHRANRFQLATLLYKSGQLQQALDVYAELYEQMPEDRVRLRIGQCLAKGATHPTLLSTALEDGWADASQLARQAIARLEVPADLPDYDAVLQGDRDWPGFFTQPILLTLLKSGVIADEWLEAHLAAFRKAALVHLASGAAGDSLDQDLLAALAHQCFMTDYVYPVGEHEIEALETLKGLQDTTSLLMRAAYGEPLEVQEDSGAPALEQVYEKITRDPARERDFAASLASLGRVQEGTSKDVAAFYEAYPYPRWEKAELVEPGTTRQAWFRYHFPKMAEQTTPATGPEKILIAGGGTGQHPIRTARTCPQSEVSVIDLSRTSLGYARRKAADLGVGNLTFYQADILTLPDDFGPFDVVESVGVLHHMKDTSDALSRLAAKLRSGGVIKVGLYSALARQGLNRLRAWVAEQGFEGTPHGIKLARQALRDPAHRALLEEVMALGDYYSTSGCADLLFHIQEQQFSLPNISAMLDHAGLTFAGFEIDPAVSAHYRRQFSDDEAMTSLDNWAAFEQDHPGTFLQMYQFWAVKP